MKNNTIFSGSARSAILFKAPPAKAQTYRGQPDPRPLPIGFSLLTCAKSQPD